MILPPDFLCGWPILASLHVPDGCTEPLVLGWRSVSPDMRSAHDPSFRWPWPGRWTPVVDADASDVECGRGLHVALTWRGASAVGPVSTALIVAYRPADVAHEGQDKVRVRRALVLDVIDTHALIRGAYLYGADLSGANLYGAYLSGANLYRAYLTGANLYRADLTGADLTGANLTGANLSGANLYGAYLSGANLYRAYLTGANLTGANLTRADLYRANLTRANLSGADLSGADLSGADLSGALGDARTVLPDGWVVNDGLIVMDGA